MWELYTFSDFVTFYEDTTRPLFKIVYENCFTLKKKYLV